MTNLNEINQETKFSAAASKWFQKSAEVDEVKNLVNKAKRRPGYKLNKHKLWFVMAGILIFPVLNIILSHKGWFNLGILINLDTFVAQILAIMLPVLFEVFQGVTSQPFFEKVAHGDEMSPKDYIEIVLISSIIIVITGMGIHNMAAVGKLGVTAQYVISYGLASLFTAMTLYCHNGYKMYYVKSAKELDELTNFNLPSNFVGLNEVQNLYKRALISIVSSENEAMDYIDIKALPSASIEPEKQAETKPNERPKIGFQSNVKPIDESKNEPNESRIYDTSIGRVCLNCDESFEPNHKIQKYCCDACRIDAYKKRTGKDLMFKKAKN